MYQFMLCVLCVKHFDYYIRSFISQKCFESTCYGLQLRVFDMDCCGNMWKNYLVCHNPVTNCGINLDLWKNLNI